MTAPDPTTPAVSAAPVDVLRELEYVPITLWKGMEALQTTKQCPWCSRLEGERHAPNCRLHAALTAPPSDEVARLREERDALRHLNQAYINTPVGQWIARATAAEAKVAALVEALQRISASTPRNTNSSTADDMRSWCKAVAESALAQHDSTDGADHDGEGRHA